MRGVSQGGSTGAESVDDRAVGQVEHRAGHRSGTVGGGELGSRGDLGEARTSPEQGVVDKWAEIGLGNAGDGLRRESSGRCTRPARRARPTRRPVPRAARLRPDRARRRRPPPPPHRRRGSGRRPRRVCPSCGRPGTPARRRWQAPGHGPAHGACSAVHDRRLVCSTISTGYDATLLPYGRVSTSSQ